MSDPSDQSTEASAPAQAAKTTSTEEVFYDGGPHPMDLVLGLLAALTVVGIPLAVGAVVRALWLRFRITDRTIVVKGGFLGRTVTTVSFGQIREVRSVSRGFGLYGDMVLLLKEGGALEMRSLPDYRRWRDLVEERCPGKAKAASRRSGQAGFSN
ncbi:MAG: PH domain-containing protein [Synechococcus sp. SB0662_bin_45]|uniref:PH domain-containing protein n=1 Tax=Synechococcus sp. SB0676_bin_10 TaxID=2604869 RepID=A0A6B1F8T5_9SYNE|nr:PH domain-containing protein [Cyanobacteria bacterium MAG IRC3_bin_20]MDE0647152.1 PH domain-containing protein [Cyanobacteria bacterium MAG IRC4_bin_6]MXW11644.1 PH domain-containing protein [Synechococcus sp. SB0668_bin_13]MXX08749.1 PH domain-containing protein [Synechococcus sp. SB0667_bin_8]MXY18954.1 PH domain-containing protein [Synechococcus sp. SB0664_bin_36]MYE21664.1 PH domain-containing protein [Synechococcus sp. SB0662_bin_45]MYG38196.1 PH domain-containing protein [Synechococ